MYSLPTYKYCKYTSYAIRTKSSQKNSWDYIVFKKKKYYLKTNVSKIIKILIIKWFIHGGVQISFLQNWDIYCPRSKNNLCLKPPPPQHKTRVLTRKKNMPIKSSICFLCHFGYITIMVKYNYVLLSIL